jgi:hypothetical protein
MKMRADVLAGVNQRLAATTKQKEKGEGERHAKARIRILKYSTHSIDYRQQQDVARPS